MSLRGNGVPDEMAKWFEDFLQGTIGEASSQMTYVLSGVTEGQSQGYFISLYT